MGRMESSLLELPMLGLHHQYPPELPEELQEVELKLPGLLLIPPMLRSMQLIRSHLLQEYVKEIHSQSQLRSIQAQSSQLKPRRSVVEKHLPLAPPMVVRPSFLTILPTPGR